MNANAKLEPTIRNISQAYPRRLSREPTEAPPGNRNGGGDANVSTFAPLREKGLTVTRWAMYSIVVGLPLGLAANLDSQGRRTSC
jgi:hypothetical protein